MTGLAMLDVAIGLIFIYLLLGLVCSALGELVERFVKPHEKSPEEPAVDR